MQSGPHFDREPMGPVADRESATDPTGWAVKGGEEAVLSTELQIPKLEPAARPPGCSR